MKSWKVLLLWLLPTFIIGFFFWQSAFSSAPASNVSNTASARMTYGRFFEYLDSGRIEKVDLFDGQGGPPSLKPMA